MFHKSIDSLRKNLGYHGTLDGCSQGVTLRWLEACILNEENIFDARIRKINAEGDSLVQSINNVKRKVRDKEKLTQEEIYLLDILAFYESIELYHSSYKFSGIFNNKNLTQQDIDSISSHAASDQIQARGGLTTVYSEPGIYTIDEISAYLDELAKAIQESGCTPEEMEGIILGNEYHTIGLTYQPQVGWKFMDINQYPSMTFKPTQEIAEKITTGFKRSANASPYFAFNTSVIVTGNHANRSQLIELLATVQKHHLITSEIAQREERINLAWIAAKYGHANHIMALKDAGANLDKVANNGKTPAFIAAQNAHANVIIALGQAGADLDKADNRNRTPAYIAAKEGHTDVITALGVAHADLDKADNDGATPAFAAAVEGHAKVITALGVAHANLDKQINDGRTPAFIAAVAGHANVITALGDAGADLDKAMNNGKTPAFIAAQKGYTDVIIALGQAGADLDKADNSDRTPAFIAAQSGHTEVIIALGVAHANLDKPINDGATPAFVAAEEGHANVITALGDAGADLDKPINDGRTPAFVAAEEGHANVITALGDAGADLDKPINDGRTPAFIAAVAGHANVITALGDAGADLDKAMNNGKTPAFIAAQKGYTDVIIALGQAGADLDKPIKDGATPAFVAAEEGHANVITALGDAGANLDKPINDGKTPAFIAAQNGHADVITALLVHKAKMDTPFIFSAESLRDFFDDHGESVRSRITTIITNQLDAGGKIESIAIKPCDIAWVMGHDAIVNLLSEIKLEVTSAGMFAPYNSKKPASELTEEKESKKDTGPTPK